MTTHVNGAPSGRAVHTLHKKVQVQCGWYVVSDMRRGCGDRQGLDHGALSLSKAMSLDCTSGEMVKSLKVSSREQHDIFKKGEHFHCVEKMVWDGTRGQAETPLEASMQAEEG